MNRTPSKTWVITPFFEPIFVGDMVMPCEREQRKNKGNYSHF